LEVVRVALDRQSIEKKDFPIGRRGYDPDAVDAHLKALADELDTFKSSARRRSETLASSASEQVRAIVEAAETSAAEIQRQAEEDAQEIRAEAASEAHTTREQATSQARDYVSRVSESTTVMMQRLEAMEGELGALIEALRTGGNRLSADLQLLQGNLGEVGEAVGPRPRFEPEPEPPPAAAPPPPPPPPPAAPPPPRTTVAQAPPPAPEPAAAPAPPATPAEEVRAPASAADDDTEGARLIALNMALNGTPREETDRYLEENFQLSDRGALLDEVYASVEG
jgi:DivIVA domain-containing protein